MISFCVHARDEALARPHRVEAEGYVDAALAYAERWLGQVDDDGAVTLIVEADDTGETRCLTLDLGSGEARPCG